MTGPSGFDRTLSAWLDEAGAQDIPPRVIDAAIDRARHTRRARPLPDVITRFLPMTTNFAASPPLVRPRPLARLGPIGVLVALTLLALALVGAALLSVGSPAPVGPARNGLIAYDSDGDIWVADPDNDYAVRPLTTTTAQESNPVWSPDGTRIAYWSNDGGMSSIGIMDAQGTVLQTVTKPADLDLPQGGTPSWSPDGKTIAVVAGLDYGSSVFIDAQTGDARKFPVYVQVPSWSPDGSLVAWGSPSGDPHVVSVASSEDGSGARQLSTPGRIAGSAAFSPDGRRVVYAEQSPGMDPTRTSSASASTGTIRPPSSAGRPTTSLRPCPRTGRCWRSCAHPGPPSRTAAATTPPRSG